MPRIVQLVAVLLCVSLGNWAGTTWAASLLIISIDGLHPELVMQAEHHRLKIPNLRRFVTEGAYARGVVGVVPTVTYPSHTTMLTGMSPAEHGIVSNTPFDPLAKNREGWYWYAEDIRVPTLWSVAASAGLTTASVNWPVTVGEKHIDFLLPEYWRASTSEDMKLLRALARPEGLQVRLEKELGSFTDGATDTLAADEIRTRFALAIIRDHKPRLTAVHLVALDGEQHAHGPHVPSVYATLEALDGMIGQLTDAARANDASTVVAVVSDHGFIATHTAINLRIAFVEAGLIDIDTRNDGAPSVSKWQAQLWPGGASAAVMLHDAGDNTARTKVATLLDRLAADSRNGIARVLNKQQLAASGGFPNADFLIELAPGFYPGNALRGDLRVPATSKGTHGYMPQRPEMHACFFISGNGIARGRDLGVIDMRQIAPTLADVLGVPLPTASGTRLEIRSASEQPKSSSP